MENKNTIIALLLILGLWFGYSIFFPPAPLQQGTNEGNQKLQTVQDTASPAPISSPVAPVAADKHSPAALTGIEELEVEVETEHFRAVLTNHGGRIKEFVLKGYRKSAEKDAPLMTLVGEGPARFHTLKTFAQDGLSIPEDLPFIFQGEARNFFISEGEETQIRFVSTFTEGAALEKIYTFYGDRYDFDLQLRLVNEGGMKVQGTLGLSLVNRWDESMEGSRYEFVGPTTFVGDDINNDDVSDLEEKGPTTYPDAAWTAFGTKYFVSILKPLEGGIGQVRVEKVEGAVQNTVTSPLLSISPGEAVTLSYVVYMGPKDLDVLKAAGHEFQRIIDFGFFAPIARPLLHFLKFIYRYLGNYGLAIILLTVIIKAIFWPLTQKSYASMKGMQKLQPQMQKIREKYKNDRERLNRELMELYRENRVNPLGGCLPMVVQIPVFFALYKVLLFSIELRHAPFALWITDLSAKDPYYVTPVIMGITMFLQQKLTPTTMDPTQAKIFMIMPVVFTLLFLNFPSGLVIYWLVNNVLTIGQQVMINRQGTAKT